MASTVAEGQQQVDEARAAGDRRALADALVVLGALLQNADRAAEAVTANEEAVTIDRELGDDVALMWALENLASRYAYAQRFADSVTTTEERVAYFRLVDDQPALATALIYLGAYLQNVGRAADAVTANEEAVAVDRKVGDATQLMWALENLASRYAFAQRFADSVTTTEERVAYFRLVDDQPALATALIYLGAYLQNVGRAADAVAANEEAVAVDRKVGDATQLMWALENLASRYGYAQRFADAVTATEERVAHYRQVDDRAALANALIFLGAYLQNAARADDAVTANEEAVAIDRELGDETQLLWALENLAARLANAQRPEAAQQAQDEWSVRRVLPDLGYSRAPAGTVLTIEQTLARYAHVWLPAGVTLPFPAQVKAIAAQLTDRFCAVPDRVDADGGLHPNSYGGANNGFWARGNLTWSVDPTGARMPAAQIDTQLTAAFAAWAAVAPGFFTFTRPATGGDLRIRFGDDPADQFGAPGGRDGLAFYPNQDRSGEIAFDIFDPWAAGGVPKVVLHEIGHALGLSHSPTPGDVMYPFAGSGSGFLQLDDITALQRLYDWTPPRLAAGRTGDRPALAAAGRPTFVGEPPADRLYLTWRGVGGDRRLYFSAYDGSGWSPAQQIPGHFSSHGPAMTTVVAGDSGETGLFMVHNGGLEDTALYYSTMRPDVGETWSERRPVDGISINSGPAVEVIGNRMYLAYKGLDDDHRIHWSVANLDGWHLGDPLVWTHQGPILGIGTSDAPYLISFRRRLYLFWRGIDDDSVAYYTWRETDPDALWQAQRKVRYVVSETEGQQWQDITVSFGPSAIVRENRVVLAWTPPGDAAVFTAQFDGDDWNGAVQVRGFGTSAGPAIGQWDDHEFIASQGAPWWVDDGIFYSRLG